MKKLCFYVTLCFFTVPSLAVSGQSNLNSYQNTPVLGAGSLSCRVVLKNTEDKGLRKFYENWAQGWISATNYFNDTIKEGMLSKKGKKLIKNHPHPVKISPRRDVIWYKILGYCSEEPKATLADAVKDLLKAQWEKAED